MNKITINSVDYQRKLLMKLQELNIAVCEKGFLQRVLSDSEILKKAERTLTELDKIIKRIKKLE